MTPATVARVLWDGFVAVAVRVVAHLSVVLAFLVGIAVLLSVTESGGTP